MSDKIVDNSTNNKKENKVLKVVSNILFVIFMLIMAFLIFITAQSRFTGQEPSLFGHRFYIVDTGSMVPTLPVDSMIIVREIDATSNIEKGDIVTYYAGNGNTRVTHRVAQVVEDEKFITRGDANNTDDPNILDRDRIIGKLVLTIPYLGTVFRTLSSKIGIAILITLGLMWIIAPIVIKRFR